MVNIDLQYYLGLGTGAILILNLWTSEKLFGKWYRWYRVWLTVLGYSKKEWWS